MSKIIKASYQDTAISFTPEAWFNATEAAAKYGKNPAEWRRLPSTEEYIAALERRYGKIPYVKTVSRRLDHGGGTWLHPKLAVRFAQWLDLDFAVWCDEQIDGLIRGADLRGDWRRFRHEAASSFKVMAAVLQLAREDQGKATRACHYMTEAKLVNWVLKGVFGGLDRDALKDPADLDLLARLEEQNAILLACKMPYEARKAALSKFASDWRQSRTMRLAA